MKKISLHPYCKPVFFAILLIGLFVFDACKKPEYTLLTTEDTNITGYLEKNADQFSLFAQIVERSGSGGFLGAYGNYTLFTPTNEAVTQWLQSIGKSSVNDLSPEELKKVVNYHLVMDTIKTKDFNDGKLRQLTQFGQYLSTSVSTAEGVSSYIINKSAVITKTNIRTGNGYIQVINKVLVPNTKTLAKVIADNDRYNMFEEALIATGLYDLINIDPVNQPDATKRFYSVIAESDSALKAAGFANFTALKNKLSGTGGNPKSPSDSLYLYVAYHITPSANYIADIASLSSLTTTVPAEIISTQFKGRTAVLNEFEINGDLEPGAPLNRTYSDVSASNGVLHESQNFFKIKVRFPTPLYWDVAEIEGVKDHPSYLKANIDINMGTLLTSINPNGYRASKYVGGQPSEYQYNVSATPRFAYKNDILRFAQDPANGARPNWNEIRTPMIVKGVYKVWVCYPDLSNNLGHKMQIIIDPGTPDEQIMPLIWAVGQDLNSAGVNLTAVNSDALLEGAGFKRYIALTTETTVNSSGQTISGNAAANNGENTGRLVGIANIKTTDRHWIRIVAKEGAGNRIIPIDMIHFIPINMDQQYPRFSVAGGIFKRP